MGQIFLTETSNQVETDLLLDLLRQEGIAALAQTDEASEGLGAYLGGSAYGDRIFVDEADYAAAKDIVYGYFQNNGQEEKNE